MTIVSQTPEKENGIYSNFFLFIRRRGPLNNKRKSMGESNGAFMENMFQVIKLPVYDVLIFAHLF